MTSKEEIVAAIRRCTQELGRVPTTAELKARGISWYQVYFNFRGIRAAIRAAGLEPGPKGGPIGENAMLLDWGRVVRELGRLPYRSEYNRLGKYHAGTLHLRLDWSQMAHRFVLMVKEYGQEEWGDVVEVIEKRFPLLRSQQLATGNWQLAKSTQHSAVSIQPLNGMEEDTETDSRMSNAAVEGRFGRELTRMDANEEMQPQRTGRNTEEAEGFTAENAEGAEESFGREFARMNANEEESNAAIGRSVANPAALRAMGLKAVVAATLALEILLAARGVAEGQASEGKAAVQSETTRPVQRVRASEAKPRDSKGYVLLPKANVPVNYGRPIGVAAMAHAPTNEAGVLFLFGALAPQLGFRVERIQTMFPDCEAKREIRPGVWVRVRIEFEFESRNFRDHGHDPKGCEAIVCWRHNWAECPEEIEVIELSKCIGASDDRVIG